MSMKDLKNEASDMASTMKDHAQDMMGDMKKSSKAMLDCSADEMKRCGKDWLDYVQTHPVQSALFGLIGYFAIKGFFKN